MSWEAPPCTDRDKVFFGSYMWIFLSSAHFILVDGSGLGESWGCGWGPGEQGCRVLS